MRRPMFPMLPRGARSPAPSFAVDLGTANSLVSARGRGIVVDTPSVLALDAATSRVLAVGETARAMLVSTPPGVVVAQPLRDGVIHDLPQAVAMLRSLLERAQSHRLHRRPRVAICVPSGATDVERSALRAAAAGAGAREPVLLIDEPLAAAFGLGADPEPTVTAQLVVDIGGGTTEVAIVSAGTVVVSESMRVAGNEMDEAIARWVRMEHHLAIGLITAESLKCRLASVSETGEHLEATGLDLATSAPRTVVLGPAELLEVLAPITRAIVDAVAEVLERTPPDLLADVLAAGVALTGGGSLLPGLVEQVEARLEIPAWRAPDPLISVVRGAQRLIDHPAAYRELARSA
jgi:rod shape-determining protein MreB